MSDVFKKLQEEKARQVAEYERVMTKGINDYAYAVELKERLKGMLDECCVQTPCGNDLSTLETLENLWNAIRDCIPDDFIDEYEAIKTRRVVEGRELTGGRVN